MRRGSIVSLSLVALATGSLLALAPAAAQGPKPPPDITFDQGKDSPGPVTFSHEVHKKNADKCTVCHVKVFKMKKGQSGPLTMEKMKAGEQCGVCHDGKSKTGNAVAFSVSDTAKCETCHKKKG